MLSRTWLSIQSINFFDRLDRRVFLQCFFSKMTNDRSQFLSLLNQLTVDKPQWTIDLERNWCVKRIYDQLYFCETQEDGVQHVVDEIIELPFKKEVALSAQESIILLPASDNAELQRTRYDEEKVFKQELWLTKGETLFFRKRRPGDRIMLTDQLNKKISRFFIDKKVPNNERNQSWVVTDSKGNVIGVVPFVFSYLSIVEEPDKIHYILLYKYRKKQPEGESNVR